MIVQPKNLVQLSDKFFVLMVLALIVFLIVKFLILVREILFYVQINHVDHQLINVLDQLLVNQDILVVIMETASNHV